MSERARLLRRIRPVTLFGVLAVVAVLTTGCAVSATPVSQPLAQVSGVVPDIDYSAVTIDENLVYDESTGQTADVCSPPAVSGEARPVVVSIHGGSWARGDKANADWRPICQWFASEGFVAVSVNYRLAPAAVFPAQIDDVSAAIAWLREPAQVERFGIDPERIAAFGGSAGGNLAALVGTRGSGSLTTGTRVAAVVDLSGPSDLTSDGMVDDDPIVGIRSAVESYLACDTLDDCPVAEEASPVFAVDPSDSPFFIAHSDVERIPLSQSEELQSALESAGVESSLTVVSGAAHSIAMLDDALRSSILEFLRARLGVETPRTAVLSIDEGTEAVQ